MFKIAEVIQNIVFGADAELLLKLLEGTQWNIKQLNAGEVRQGTQQGSLKRQVQQAAGEPNPVHARRIILGIQRRQAQSAVAPHGVTAHLHPALVDFIMRLYVRSHVQDVPFRQAGIEAARAPAQGRGEYPVMGVAEGGLEIRLVDLAGMVGFAAMQHQLQLMGPGRLRHIDAVGLVFP